MKKKIISLLLAVVMIVGMLPLSAITAFAETDVAAAVDDGKPISHKMVTFFNDAKAEELIYEKSTSSLSDGYYLVGTLNGENFWDMSSLTSDMKLEPSGTNDEYKLDWTFYEGDRVKVVKVKDGVITAWYNNDGEYYKIGKSNAGESTLYFRTEGNAEWSYFFLTVTPNYSIYCLCGYINGADYGMTEQSNPKLNEPGEYVFSKDGTLTVTFTKDSYVQLKTLHGEYWYAFEKYVEDGTPTRLYEQSDTYKEKMFVPAETQVTFTLSKDTSGAFVLGYQIDAYTVSFNIMGHGTDIPSQTVVSGGKVQKPADPVADGYKFCGWFKDENCTEEWNFDTDTVTGDITLYAKWKVFATPTADDFNFVPPANCVYNGQPKQASIYTVKEGMGVITLKYQKYNGIGWDTATTDAPTEIGKYRVVVSVEEGVNYAASAADITSESWVFEITAPACTHENRTVSYEWGTSPRSCTARLICDDCHAVLERETLSGLEISPPHHVPATKCTERSYVYFVAEFENELFGSVESEKEYFDIGPHSYVDYVCEYCHVAEDLEGAKSDAIKAIHNAANHSEDTIVNLLAETAEAAIHNVQSVAEVIALCNRYVSAIEQLTGTTHEHTYSENWTCDPYYHWHNATCEHTNIFSDLAEHSFDNGVVNGNVTEYTCSECGYQKIVYNTAGDNEGEIVTGISYTGISLTLGSDIAINFYMNLTDEAKEKGTMTFDIGGRIVTGIKVRKNENGYYFSTPLTALEMAETVKATFTYNGVEYVQKYSAQDYIDKIVGNSETYGTEAAALARKIANYGYYAQIYLESIHTNVHIVDSGNGYDRMDKFESFDIDTQAAIEALANYTVKVTGASDNISLYGSTVYFDSATALNYYVTVKNGVKPTATAVNKVTGETKQVEIKFYKDNIYIVSVKDITATELADDIEVKINNEITITGSVFAYCNSVVKAHNIDGASDKDIFAVNAMAAFYEYHKAAMEYISFDLHFDIPEKYKVFTADGEEITGEKTVKCYRTFSFRLVPDDGYIIYMVNSEGLRKPDENGLYTVSFTGGKHNVVVYTELDTYRLTVNVEGEDGGEMPDTKILFVYDSHESIEAQGWGPGIYRINVPKGKSGTIVITKSGYQEYRQEFTADGTVEEISVSLVPDSFSVTFDMMGHGEQISSQTVEKNGKVTKPTSPTADNKEFAGWYKDENCTVKWNFDTDTVTANTTLYAKWREKTDFSQYSLCGVINGHEYGMDGSPIYSVDAPYMFSSDGELTVTFSSKSTIKLRTVNGQWWYYFEENVFGGTVSKLFETKYEDRYNGGIMTVEDEGRSLTFTLSKDEDGALMLGYEYAVPPYTVYFTSIFGNQIPDQKVKPGGKVKKPADPVAEGYEFGGWYKDPDYNEIWNFDTDTVTAITDLFAKWTPIQ